MTIDASDFSTQQLNMFRDFCTPKEFQAAPQNKLPRSEKEMSHLINGVTVEKIVTTLMESVPELWLIITYTEAQVPKWMDRAWEWKTEQENAHPNLRDKIPIIMLPEGVTKRDFIKWMGSKSPIIDVSLQGGNQLLKASEGEIELIDRHPVSKKEI